MTSIAPELLDGQCCGRPHLRHVGHVGDLGECRTARGDDAADDSVQTIGVDVDADDTSAASSAFLGDDPAESTTGTGDDDGLVLQVI